MSSVVKRARSRIEMLFYAEQHPCSACATRPALASLDEAATFPSADRAVITYTGNCATCGAPLRYEFDVPRSGFPEMDAYGGDEPSELFSASEWRAMAEARARGVVADPSSLDVTAYFVQRGGLVTALRMLDEAKKSAPDDAPAIDARAAQLKAHLATFELELPARTAASAALPRPAPRTLFNRATLDAHAAWLKRGKTGDGRMVLDDVSVGGMALGGLVAASSRLIKVSFNNATVGFGHFEDAELVECTAIEANLSRTIFERASLERCTFERTALMISHFNDARIAGGSFRSMNCDRGEWKRVTIKNCDLRDAVFGDAILDGSRFEDCDLRGADLSRHSTLPICTTRDATFRNCDLRGAKLGGRRLDHTSFIDCNLTDIDGTPDLVGPFNATGEGAAALMKAWGS